MHQHNNAYEERIKEWNCRNRGFGPPFWAPGAPVPVRAAPQTPRPVALTAAGTAGLLRPLGPGTLRPPAPRQPRRPPGALPPPRRPLTSRGRPGASAARSRPVRVTGRSRSLEPAAGPGPARPVPPRPLPSAWSRLPRTRRPRPAPTGLGELGTARGGRGPGLRAGRARPRRSLPPASTGT